MKEIEIKVKYKQLEKELIEKYGIFYPNDNDKEGWRLLGKLEALAWVLEK